MELKTEFKEIVAFEWEKEAPGISDKKKLRAYVVQMITEFIFKGFTSGNKWKLSKAVFTSPFFLYKLVQTIWKIGKMYYLYFNNRTMFQIEIEKHNKEFIF